MSGLWWEKLASRRGTMALARIEAGEEVLSVPTSILLRSLLLLNRSLLLLNRSLLTRTGVARYANVNRSLLLLNRSISRSPLILMHTGSTSPGSGVHRRTFSVCWQHISNTLATH